MVTYYNVATKEFIMSKKDNEYKDYIYSVRNVNPYPVRGSTGVYLGSLGEILKNKIVSDTAFKLFIFIATDVDEHNQTTRSRKEFSDVLGIRHNKSRMSKLVKELVENELVAIFAGDIITVNPFLVIPSIKEPKMKAAIQEAWRDIVEYGYE